MSFEIEHYHYNHQIHDPAKYPGVGLYKVFQEGTLVAVVREVHPEMGVTDDEGFDLRVDAHDAHAGLTTRLNTYFPGRRVAYHSHGGSWQWNDNGTYQAMPWGRTTLG